MFERVAFFVMSFVAIAAIAAAVALHLYDVQVNNELRDELMQSKVANQEWLHAFQKLSERVSPTPAPPRRPGQIGDAPH